MNIGIVGLGLIGGSIGRAIIKKTSHTVFAIDNDDNAMLKGELLKAYHSPLDEENAKKLDILIICVYPAAVAGIIDKYAPLLPDGAIITDCAGIKRDICAVMEGKQKEYPNIAFIGGHPMAGREFSGVEHSTAGLFEHSTCILIPIHTSIEPLITVKELYLAIGADRVVVSTADKHDKIIAYTSQLCHVVSNAFVMSPTADVYYGYSANSFRDLTRVARLNPEMWTDLMMTNGDFLTEELDVIIARLNKMNEALKTGDRDALRTMLAEGNEAKLKLEANKTQKLNEAAHGGKK